MRIKKGFQDISVVFFVMAFLFATGLLIVILYYTWGQISNPLTTAISSALPNGETAFNVTSTNNKLTTTIGIFDSLYPFLILGLIVMSMVFAYYSENSSVFLFISFIILAVAILLGAIFGNVFQQITQSPELASTGQEFNITSIFFQNFPLIITIIVVIVMVIMFSLSKGVNRGI